MQVEFWKFLQNIFSGSVCNYYYLIRLRQNPDPKEKSAKSTVIPAIFKPESLIFLRRFPQKTCGNDSRARI